MVLRQMTPRRAGAQHIDYPVHDLSVMQAGQNPGTFAEEPNDDPAILRRACRVCRRSCLERLLTGVGINDRLDQQNHNYGYRLWAAGNQHTAGDKTKSGEKSF